jgi:hypothetical protein
MTSPPAFLQASVAFDPLVALGWRGFWERSTLRNSKIAILCYDLAVGFILVVAFHSPAKVLVTVDAPAPTLS